MKWRPRLITSLAIAAVVGLLAVGLLPGSGPAPLEAQGEIGVKEGRPPAATYEVIPGELIVKFRPGTSRADRAAAIQAGGAVLISQFLPDFALLRVPEGREQKFTARLQAHPLVELVEPNAIVRVNLFVPNDPKYSDQWHMPQIQMEQAWDAADGSGVVVAIIDSGVAYENYLGFKQAPDLACTSFTPGWDFWSGDAHPNDDHGHGTHVAGTVAQCTNNSLGVAGVASGATIMPVKVVSKYDTARLSDIAAGIRWATDHGADVINLSLGYDHVTSWEAAVNYALDHGVVVVAASGNGYASTLQCPACYPGVIAVGATDYNKNRAPYSNYGTGRGGHTLDLVAPGGDTSGGQSGGVLQQTFEDICDDPAHPPVDLTSFVYCFFQGTSMAAPHVSGAAAVLLSANPDLTRQQVAGCLTSTALDRGDPGYDLRYGYGLIQVRDALEACAGPPELVGDFDGDGKDDVVNYNAASGHWWVNVSTGSSFTPELWSTFSTKTGWGPQMVGDFDGDGKDDVVNYHSRYGTWWVNRSTGSAFDLELWATFSTKTGWDPQMVGDFNGDGKDDIVSYHPRYGTWWVNVSDGSKFTLRKWATFSTKTGWDPQMVGDFNGDGYDDVVSYHSRYGTWWVNVSDGLKFTLRKWATFDTRTGWDPQMVGNFDGDPEGKDDIVSYHSRYGTWWVNVSDGTKFDLEKWATFSTRTGWDPQMVGNFDGDLEGKDDVVSYYSRHGTWWVNVSDGTKFDLEKWAP